MIRQPMWVVGGTLDSQLAESPRTRPHRITGSARGCARFAVRGDWCPVLDVAL
jgi:hypothetical protein